MMSPSVFEVIDDHSQVFVERFSPPKLTEPEAMTGRNASPSGTDSSTMIWVNRRFGLRQTQQPKAGTTSGFNRRWRVNSTKENSGKMTMFLGTAMISSLPG